MFSTMNTPLLDIRASQNNGNVNFTGAFTGYRNDHSVQVTLQIDTELLEQIGKSSATPRENYTSFLADVELMTYGD